MFGRDFLFIPWLALTCSCIAAKASCAADAPGVERPRLIGVNYLSLYHRYTTPDVVLRRDFNRFRDDGLNVISLHLYWYRLEGDARGDYSGKGRRGDVYGDPFLANVRRVIHVADECGLKVLVTFHTLWNEPWCTPSYVKDPTTGKNHALAIMRDKQMQGAFVATVSHAVEALRGTRGIWAWALLNEPWYWPHKLKEPYDKVDQRAMGVQLVERLAQIVKERDGRPVTVRFVNMHTWKRRDGGWGWKNIFVDDWRWDERLFRALDFVSLNAYMPKEQSLRSAWRQTLAENVDGVARRFNKPVFITEFGAAYDDDEAQASSVRESTAFFRTLRLQGWLVWMWNSERELGGGGGRPGRGFNICSDADGAPRSAYNELKQQ